MALIAVCAGALFVRRMADPIGTVTSGLSDEISEDGFENVLGRRFFRDKADNLMKKNSDQTYGVVLVAINNFDDIIEKFYPSFPEKQKGRMITILKEVFSDAECIGRVGENSFSVLLKNSGKDEEAFRILSESRAKDACDKFRQSEYTSTMGLLELTADSAAAIGKGDFRETYYKAYTSLCASVKSGHNVSSVM